MNINKILLLLLAVVIVPVGFLHSQSDEFLPELVGTPRFYFDAISLESGELGVSRMDVYIEVPYEALHFFKLNDAFRSSYDMTINIYDSVETLINEKWWTEKIETKDYNESVSPARSNLSHQSFMLIPGKYFIEVQLKDNETQKVTRLKRKVDVRNYFSPKFSMSDILVASRIEMDSGKIVVYPNISGNVGTLRDSFYIFFEMYNSISADSAKIVVTIHNVKGDSINRDSFMYALGSLKKSCFYQITTSQFIAGDYLLEVRVVPKLGSSGFSDELSAIATRSFVIRWRGLPLSISDLDLAIDQIQYISSRDKLDEIKKAYPERKKELFRDFWKKKDPTPNTERNELMEEYYSRVQYANKHFGHYIDGWKSDMGMIYIIFGVPSNIERHPFEMGSKPYEVWTYYELNREFIFVDVSGFGDYRLQNPLWDIYRTQPR